MLWCWLFDMGRFVEDHLTIPGRCQTSPVLANTFNVFFVFYISKKTVFVFQVGCTSQGIQEGSEVATSRQAAGPAGEVLILDRAGVWRDDAGQGNIA